jgi:hypothetical protein
MGPKNGRGGRTRTRDLRFWRPLLYHLSYAPAPPLFYLHPKTPESESLFLLKFYFFLSQIPRIITRNSRFNIKNVPFFVHWAQTLCIMTIQGFK